MIPDFDSEARREFCRFLDVPTHPRLIQTMFEADRAVHYEVEFSGSNQLSRVPLRKSITFHLEHTLGQPGLADTDC